MVLLADRHREAAWNFNETQTQKYHHVAQNTLNCVSTTPLNSTNSILVLSKLWTVPGTFFGITLVRGYKRIELQTTGLVKKIVTYTTRSKYSCLVVKVFWNKVCVLAVTDSRPFNILHCSCLCHIQDDIKAVSHIAMMISYKKYHLVWGGTICSGTWYQKVSQIE